jgi:hypothetical protein
MMPVWLLRYLPHLIAAVAVVAAAAWGVHKIREGVRDELEPEIRRLETQLRAERADRARAETALDAYRAELDGLASRTQPATPVRLCRTAPVRSPKPPTEGADAAAPAAGGDAGQVGADSGEGSGPDIGPDLRDLAASCDAISARLRALQGWVSSDPDAPRP